MMRSLWISKTGLEAQQTQLDTISNNLANVSTNGFKRAAAVFEDLMYQNLRQAGANSTEQTPLPTGPAGRPRRARRRHRAQLQPGQPAADRQPARRRDQRQRLLPGADARRHHRLHARRLVPGRRAGPARHHQRLPGAARHHDPGQRAERDDRPRRHGQRHAAGPGRRRRSGQLQLAELRQPGRPASRRARTSTPRPPRRARRTPARRAERPRLAAARASSRPRTSTWSRSWSP